MSAKPYHCQLCERKLAKDEVGFVCQHFAHGEYLTYEASRAKAGRIPDTACTACSILSDARGPEGSRSAKAADDELALHVVCKRCYDARASRNVLTVKRDRRRGYALVPRAVHAALQGMKMSVAAKLEVGVFAKVVFVPIPSRPRDEFEMMWVEIQKRSGDAFTGTLANEPLLFPQETLREGSKVSLHEADVVGVAVD